MDKLINKKMKALFLPVSIFLAVTILLNFYTHKSMSLESVPQENINASETLQTGVFLKDETVYARLRQDGSFDGKVTIVNFIHPLKQIPDGKLVDFGTYDRISPLSLEAEYSTHVDAGILWQFKDEKALTGGFFYRGEMSEASLPFYFEINHFLGGNQVDPATLAGKSGSYKMEISVTPNPGTGEYFSRNFAAQIQIPLNTMLFQNVSAPGSAEVLAGKTRILNFTVLPGMSQYFTLESDVTYFETDEIQISITPFSTDTIKQLVPEDTMEKLDELSSGVKMLAEGGADLNSGITEFVDGLWNINDGYLSLSQGQQSLFTGIADYLSGVENISHGISDLSSGLNEISFGGIGLTQAYDDLKNEVFGSFESLLPLIDTLPEEEKLIHIERISTIKQQLEVYSHHLDQYVGIISEISASTEELSGGFSELTGSGDGIKNAMESLTAGSKSFSEGLFEFKNESSKISRGSQNLSSSLTVLSKELSDASIIFKDLIPQNSTDIPVSFTDNKTGINSVSIIVTVDSIKMSLPDQTEPETERVKSFWERFFDLFRRK